MDIPVDAEAVGYIRGVSVFLRDDRWFWLDGTEVKDGLETCSMCHRTCLTGEPDPCVGTIPGVENACCGHGVFDTAYISFPEYSIYFSTTEEFFDYVRRR